MHKREQAQPRDDFVLFITEALRLAWGSFR